MNDEARARSEHPVISEPLSWAEICHRYPEQWVAIVEIDWIDDSDELRSARVAGHGPRRADPLIQARSLPGRYDEIGHFFTGPVHAPLDLTFAP